MRPLTYGVGAPCDGRLEGGLVVFFICTALLLGLLSWGFQPRGPELGGALQASSLYRTASFLLLWHGVSAFWSPFFLALSSLFLVDGLVAVGLQDHYASRHQVSPRFYRVPTVHSQKFMETVLGQCSLFAGLWHFIVFASLACRYKFFNQWVFFSPASAMSWSACVIRFSYVPGYVPGYTFPGPSCFCFGLGRVLCAGSKSFVSLKPPRSGFFLPSIVCISFTYVIQSARTKTRPFGASLGVSAAGMPDLTPGSRPVRSVI